jgi:hypothetical protein
VSGRRIQSRLSTAIFTIAAGTALAWILAGASGFSGGWVLFAVLISILAAIRVSPMARRGVHGETPSANGLSRIMRLRSCFVASPVSACTGTAKWEPR